MPQLDPGHTVTLCPIVGAAPWWLGAGGDRTPEPTSEGQRKRAKSTLTG